MDFLLAKASVFLDAWRHEIIHRTFWSWVLYFLPVVILLEIPRYYGPMIGLAILRMLGLPKVDHGAREALLARAPLVSVVMAGRNEGACIEAAILSVLEQDYRNYEVIIVDDGSEDDMYAIANRYASKGLIRLLRNDAARGRQGRPSATNIGVRVARGDFIVSLDADTTFDPSMLTNLIKHFADPRVGVVGGTIVPRNGDLNLITKMQTLEYVQGIEVYKQWTTFRGTTLQASGAIGAFRRSILQERGFWDPELAEDADISLRAIKGGWKIAFAPDAQARTEVPESFGALARQRARWDRGGLRTFFQKHGRVMRPSTAGWKIASTLWLLFFFFVVVTFVYPAYLVWLFLTSPLLLPFVLGVTTAAYSLLSVLGLAGMSVLSSQIRRPWSLLPAALLLPILKQSLTLVRFRAFLEELFLVGMQDSYLPATVWANARRF